MNSKTYSREGALSDRYDKLHKTVNHLTTDNSIGDQLELISSSFYTRFLWMVGADPERTIDPKRTYELRETHIDDLFDTLQLMVRLVQLHEHWVIIEHLEAKRDSGHE